MVRQPDVALRVVARLLLGPSLVAAAGLIVKAYTTVGDGFAAGVVVALAIALCYVALGATRVERALPALRHAPLFMVGGLLLAMAAGFFPLAFGQPLFSHRPAPGQHVPTVGSLELFTPLLFDVGVFVLVVGVLTALLHQFAHPDSEADDPTGDLTDDRGDDRRPPP